MYLITTEEALASVQRFLEKTLAKSEWTHEMHLMVGFYMVITHKNEAMTQMRQAIRAYNEAVGTINSDTSGYHETITAFWIDEIKIFCKNNAITRFDEETLDVFVFEEYFADRNLFLQYYSKETILSKEARKEFVPREYIKN
ncbi:MAG: hypothetical protein RLZZ292_3916 [Bacteroidota bacterium]|jgi:hypothetical protein